MRDPSATHAAEKPKVAFYWCASCGGCEEAVVDLAEAILDVVAAVDIVFWPVALDFKRKDVEAMARGSILASFVNGAIRSTEQEEMVHLLREKSMLLVAFGACSQMGGIPALANLSSREAILETVYRESPSTVNPDGVRPRLSHQENGHGLSLPGLFETVRTLDQFTDVDYTLPGCPPMPKTILDAVKTLLGGELPPKRSVLASDRALCEQCPRKATRPEKLALKEFRRPHEVAVDEEKCLMAQGLLCMGPATRSGCEASCVRGNMPCTGCYGPTSRVRDYGGKALSAIASLVDSRDEDEIVRMLERIPDPVGTLYRYSLAGSMLRRKKLPAAAR